MDEHARSFIPALRFAWLTRFYDPLVRRTMKEKKFKELLVAQTGLRKGDRVLDLGCGTGTLTLMLKRACPEASIVGLDADPDVLGMARKKAMEAGLAVELQQGLAFEPVFEPGSFDRIVSSLVFHHLTTADKKRTLARIHELLRPAGELHIADWGRAQNALMRTAFLGVQLLDGFETTADSVRGRLVDYIRDAGFGSVTETHREMTLFGTLSLYKAVKPAAVGVAA